MAYLTGVEMGHALGRSYQSSMTLDAELPQAAMPNHVRFAAPAGSVLLFDMATW
jgi:hypothetical protein